MENKKRPAFPISEDETDRTKNGYDIFTGLTKREYFAAKAMQAYAGGEYTGQAGMSPERIAKWSVEMADALLKELSSK